MPMPVSVTLMLTPTCFEGSSTGKESIVTLTVELGLLNLMEFWIKLIRIYCVLN